MKSFNLMFFLIIFMSASSFSQEKLKVIKVSADSQPNYYSLKGERAVAKLIDESFAKRSPLWLDPVSLGWQQKETITLDFELEKLSKISRIELSTAANEAANALNPLSISVFLSVDGGSFEALEDIADRDYDGKGNYRTYKLTSKKSGKTAKFVKMIIHPQGTFFFSDQVSIYGTSAVKSQSQRYSLDMKGVKEVANQDFHSQKRKALLYSLAKADNNKQVLNQLNTSSRLDEPTYLKLLSSFKGYSSKDAVSAGKNLTITGNLTPWSLNTPSQKFGNQLKVVHVKGTTSWITLKIENGTEKPIATNLVSDLDAEYNLYEVSKIVTRKSKFLYDPLIPVAPNTDIAFKGKESKIFVLELTNVEKTKTGGCVYLSAGGSALNISLDVKDIGVNEQFKRGLNFGVNVWSYYSYPFYKNKEQAIKNDLSNHYVNVLPIAGWSIGDLSNIKEDELRRQLTYRNKDDKVLLFINHRGILSNPGDYLKESWYNRFFSWYDKVYKIIKDSGVDESQIYLYPYDEIRENEIPYFNSFAKEVKKRRPSSRFFMTIFRSSTMAKIEVPVDIQQVVITNNDLASIKAKDTFWIYDIMDDSKEVPADARFRALGWKAYFYGATGVGFWNYADVKGASLWDDNDGDRADYHAVYDQGNNVIPSLRWQAFKQGVEDYYILKKVESKIGASQLKNMISPLIKAKKVDDEQFDDVLAKILAQY